MILVYGSTSSGKSQVAEDIAVRLSAESAKQLIYLATMENKTQASRIRIDHHRKLRQGKGFTLVEEMYDPAGRLCELKGRVVLLECVSNLLANVMFDKDMMQLSPAIAARQSFELITDNITRLKEGLETDASSLVVVTNNIFGSGRSEDVWCDAYMRSLGMINVRLAGMAEQFVEVNAGLANYIN